MTHSLNISRQSKKEKQTIQPLCGYTQNGDDWLRERNIKDTLTLGLGGQRRTHTIPPWLAALGGEKKPWWGVEENSRIVCSCTVERGRSGKVKVVRHGLMWKAFLPVRAMVMFSPGMLLMPMSGSMVLPYLGSVLIFIAHVTIGVPMQMKCWTMCWGTRAVLR